MDSIKSIRALFFCNDTNMIIRITYCESKVSISRMTKPSLKEITDHSFSYPPYTIVGVSQLKKFGNALMLKSKMEMKYL